MNSETYKRRSRPILDHELLAADCLDVVRLHEWAPGTRFIVDTTNGTRYRIVVLNGAEEEVEIEGHPVICPVAAEALVAAGFMAVGRQLVFHLTASAGTVTTGAVKAIWAVGREDLLPAKDEVN